MIEIMWWNRLVNSVRFIEDICDSLFDNKSVQLVFEGDIPWKETMLDTLEQHLSEKTDSRKFEVIDASKIIKPPGEYLMDKYCSPDERKKYWPTTHGSREYFLAQNDVTVLNNRYVCITGISSGNIEKWVSSVGEYISNCSQDKDHGIFILIIEQSTTLSSKYLNLFKYRNYVSDYDCMMLCLTVISSLPCSRSQKMYICEVASNIADNRVEYAGLLAQAGLELIEDPFDTAQTVYIENGIECSDLKENIKRAVWEAQIKLVFPKLENFRAGIIRKYDHKLIRYLPIKSSNNDIIKKPSDLEIGQLYYIVNNNRADKIIDSSEYEMLKKMKNARNTLAHWEPLSYEQLIALELM